MSPGRTVAAAVVAVALLIGPSGAAASAPSSTYEGAVGINTHDVWLSVEAAYADFQRLASAGVTQVREEIPWAHTETARGRFDWSRSDRLMAAAARAGVGVLGILTYAAPWSNATGNTRQPPTNHQDYANYAVRVLDRYGPGGTFWSLRPDLPERPLEAVELWNEAWGWWNWYPEVNPQEYAALARAAAVAIQAAHPDVTIVMDADPLQVRRDGQIQGWIDQVLRAEPRLVDLIDVFGAHPYPDPRDQSPLDRTGDARWDYRQVELIRQTTLALGADKPIWITEIGWSTAPSVGDGVTEATQARFVRDALERAFQWPYVERAYVYSYDRDSGSTTDREGWFGLRHADGTPKPAFAAMADFAQSARPGTAPPPHPTGSRLAVPLEDVGVQPLPPIDDPPDPRPPESGSSRPAMPPDDEAGRGGSHGSGLIVEESTGPPAPPGALAGPVPADWSPASAFARRVIEEVCTPVLTPG